MNNTMKKHSDFIPKYKEGDWCFYSKSHGYACMIVKCITPNTANENYEKEKELGIRYNIVEIAPDLYNSSAYQYDLVSETDLSQIIY